MKYVNYLTTEEKFFQLSKEYSEEEACVFQLISNKKKLFFDFFTDFFLDLPGFITIYKEKFFSRIKDFIDDKDYIFDLEQKYKMKYPENHLNLEFNNNVNVNSNKEKNNLLGNKRERSKENTLSMLTYDTELKLLENDYPQIIDSDDKFRHKSLQIKQEKIDENNPNGIIHDENENIDDKDISLQLASGKKSKTHKTIINKKSDLNVGKEKIVLKQQNRSKKVDKSKFNPKEKNRSRKLPNSQNTSKVRRKKGKNMSIKKSDIQKVYSPIKTYYSNNIVNNTFSDSSSRKDYTINNIQEYNQNNVNMFYGINSRLDKMPKINVFKKKKYEMNYSAGKLLDDIKERLSNMGLKNKNRKKCLSDDRNKIEEMVKLKQIVNNNFYGKERLKSPVFNDKDDTTETNNESIINCETNDKKENKVNNPKKKNAKRNSSKQLPKNRYNKHISIKYRIILHYKKRKGEKIITKSEYPPEAIIIDKNAIDMTKVKILFDSLFQKKVEKKQTTKTNTSKGYILKKRKKNVPKIIRSKKQEIKKDRSQFRKLRKSTRIQHISNFSKSKLKDKNNLKRNLRRKSKIFVGIKKKKGNKKVLIKKTEEEKAFDSRSESLMFKAGIIRTNNDKDNNIESDCDQILVNKTDCFDSRNDDDAFSSRGNVKKNNINYNIDDIDALKGFNYLYHQK